MTFFMKRYLFSSVDLLFLLRLCNNNELLTKVQNRKSIKAQIILINNDDRLHHGIFITIWNVIYIWYSIKFNKNYDDWILIERITSINRNMFQFFVSDPVLILSFFYLSLFQPYSTIFLWTEGIPNWNIEQETNPRIWPKENNWTIWIKYPQL